MSTTKIIEGANQVWVEEMYQRALAELRFLSTVHHPRIVQYLGEDISVSQGLLYIFMEYLPGGSLSDNLEKYGYMKPRTVQRFALEIMEGLQFLHELEPCVVHRDIKPSNILLTLDGHCKIADFGTVKMIHNSTQNGKFMAGTLVYAPPESYESEHELTGLFDVWSLGITIYQLSTDGFPWDMSELTGLKQVARFLKYDILPKLMCGELDIWHPALDPQTQSFIESMLVLAEERPSVEELMSHPFFQTEYPEELGADPATNRYTVRSKLQKIRNGEVVTLTNTVLDLSSATTPSLTLDRSVDQVHDIQQSTSCENTYPDD